MRSTTLPRAVLCAFAGAWIWLGVPASSLAQAAPTTGVLHVSARIASGCRVVGQALVQGVDFGELDFGSHPTLFKQPLSAQSQLSSGAVQLQCVGVTSAFVSIDAGMHASGNQRRLASGEHYVPYELFLDGAHSQPVAIDTPRGVFISPNGELAVVDLSLHGRVASLLGGFPPGLFQDSVQVTVSW
jgi:spore coat protein U-like protein